MAEFSINDVLLGLKKECEILQNNWQGETSDAYLDKVMNHYMNYANAIEKCLQGINQGLEEVRADLDDDSNSIYEHSSKKNLNLRRK